MSVDPNERQKGKDMIDLLDAVWGNPTHVIEWSRVDGTSDVQRFTSRDAMTKRYDELVASEPEAIFVVSVALDGDVARPVARFRRDVDPSITVLSTERQDRARYLCASAQSRHERRYGDLALKTVRNHA